MEMAWHFGRSSHWDARAWMIPGVRGAGVSTRGDLDLRVAGWRPRGTLDDPATATRGPGWYRAWEMPAGSAVALQRSDSRWWRWRGALEDPGQLDGRVWMVPAE